MAGCMTGLQQRENRCIDMYIKQTHRKDIESRLSNAHYYLTAPAKEMSFPTPMDQTTTTTSMNSTPAATAPIPSPPTIKKIAPLNFILNAQFTIKKSDAPAFLAATKLVYDACLREPECLFYHVGRLDAIQPTWLTELPEEESEECVITFSEGWNCTLQWYKEVQFRKEYYGPHMKVAGVMWTKPRKCRLFFRCLIVSVEILILYFFLAVFELVRPEEGFCHYKEGM
jgi:quinol monooxygenase YgiN